VEAEGRHELLLAVDSYAAHICIIRDGIYSWPTGCRVTRRKMKRDLVGSLSAANLPIGRVGIAVAPSTLTP
jgi:hypothetical protein